MTQPTTTRIDRCIVIAVALLTATSLAATGAVAAGGPETAGPSANAAAEATDEIDPSTATDRRELTLATGHTVTAIEADGDRRYAVEDADGSDVGYRAVERSE